MLPSSTSFYLLSLFLFQILFVEKVSMVKYFLFFHRKVSLLYEGRFKIISKALRLVPLNLQYFSKIIFWGPILILVSLKMRGREKVYCLSIFAFLINANTVELYKGFSTGSLLTILMNVTRECYISISYIWFNFQRKFSQNSHFLFLRRTVRTLD